MIRYQGSLFVGLRKRMECRFFFFFLALVDILTPPHRYTSGLAECGG